MTKKTGKRVPNKVARSARALNLLAQRGEDAAPPAAPRTMRCPSWSAWRFRRRTGGIHGVAQPSAGRYRHGLRADSTPGSDARKPSDGAACQGKQNAGRRSEGRDSRRGQSCLRDSAAMQSEYFRWNPAYPAAAGQRPQHAHRLLSARPGGRPRRKAIGVVLSGTASDGTLGLQAIKAAGGITFAQEMQTAKFDGMPRKRHRRRRGGLCAPAGGDRAATGGHRGRFSACRSSLASA